MNAELVKEILSIGSSLAVIVTLIYLSYQLKQSRTIASMEAFRDALNLFPYYDGLGKDRDHFECIRKAMNDFNSCTPYEQHIFNTTFAPIIHHTETVWTMQGKSFMAKKNAEAFIKAVSALLATNGGQQYWELEKVLFEEKFAQIITDRIDSGAVPITEIQPWFKMYSEHDKAIKIDTDS